MQQAAGQLYPEERSQPLLIEKIDMNDNIAMAMHLQAHLRLVRENKARSTAYGACNHRALLLSRP